MEFLYYAVVFFLGWVARGIYLQWMIRNAMRALVERLAEQEKEKEETCILKLEKHAEVVYAYDQNDKFIGQGSTVQELIETLKSSHPGKAFAVTREDMEKVGFKHESV